MATNIGPKIGVEGEAEYRKSINQIIQQAKTLDAQMRATVSSFNSTTSAEEKAAAKAKILSEQITTQKERIRTLTDMMQKSAAKYGENDARTLKWREAVLNATTALNGMEQELADVNSGLDETSNNLEDAGTQAASFGDILKANVLSDVIMDGFRKLGGYIKDFASGMVEAAAEVSAQNAQFEQTFGSMANSATKNLQKIADETGIIPERLKATYTQMYAYAKSTGMDVSSAMKFASDGTLAAADAAAYYDKSFEEMADTVLSYTKGNFANDAALGFASTEATRNAQAVASLNKEYKDLDVTTGETTQVLLDQVIAAQKLSGAAGQASREMDGWENVTGNLSGTWKQLQAVVGTPVLESITPVIQQITGKLRKMMQSVDWTGFSQKVSTVLNAIIDKAPAIITAIGSVAGAVTAINIGKKITDLVAKIKVAVEFVKGIQIASKLTSLISAVKSVGTAISGVFSVLAANPIVLIIAGIAALVAAIATLWNTNEEFRNAVTTAWEKIKEVGTTVFNTVAGFFTETLPNAYNTCKTAVINFKDNAVQTFENIRNAIASKVGSIKTTIVNGFSAAVNFIRQLPQAAIGWGRDLIQGFINGIIAMWDNLKNTVANVANTISSFLHFSRPDVGPLRNYEKWMPDMMTGLARGIDANAYRVEDALMAATSGMRMQIEGTAGAGATQTTNYGGVNIVVNGAPGQDVNELAEAIMYKIENAYSRKASVFA